MIYVPSMLVINNLKVSSRGSYISINNTTLLGSKTVLKINWFAIHQDLSFILAMNKAEILIT